MKVNSFEELKAHLMTGRFDEESGYAELIADHNFLVNGLFDYLNKNFDGAEEELEGWGILKEDFILQSVKSERGDYSIRDVECQLGLKLPPSYVNAVENFGLLKFQNKWKDEYTMEDIFGYGLRTLWDEYDFPDDAGAEVENVAKKLVVFAKGDEQLQKCFHVCFNYFSLNETSGEADVFFFDQSDWPDLLACKESPITKGSSIYSYYKQASKEMLEPLFDASEGFFEN